jgi:hypothetical protein
MAFGTLAGLVHSFTLLAFTWMGLLTPLAGPQVYIPVLVLYGLAVGAALTIGIPPLGQDLALRERFGRMGKAALLAALVTIPYVFLIFQSDALKTLPARLIFAGLLPFGIGIGIHLSYRGQATLNRVTEGVYP